MCVYIYIYIYNNDNETSNNNDDNNVTITIIIITILILLLLLLLLLITIMIIINIYKIIIIIIIIIIIMRCVPAHFDMCTDHVVDWGPLGIHRQGKTAQGQKQNLARVSYIYIYMYRAPARHHRGRRPVRPHGCQRHIHGVVSKNSKCNDFGFGGIKRPF